MMLQEIDAHEFSRQTESGCEFFAFFHTPFCGTCKVAKRMVDIAKEASPDAQVVSCDLNQMPQAAQDWQITSVPCLIHFQQSKDLGRIYAFQSVDRVFYFLKGDQNLRDGQDLGDGQDSFES